MGLGFERAWQVAALPPMPRYGRRSPPTPARRMPKIGFLELNLDKRPLILSLFADLAAAVRAAS